MTLTRIGPDLSLILVLILTLSLVRLRHNPSEH